MVSSDGGPHAWRFFRAGGVDQVLLAHADDLFALSTLDQKLWVALSCPVKGLEFDERTLALLDTDGDGRVRAPELLAAVAWLKGVLRDPAGLVDGTDGVPLSALDLGSANGSALLEGARRVLAVLGKPDHPVVTGDDAMQATALWARAPRNGDGVVPPGSMPDEETRDAAADCLRTIGGVDDRSGEHGIDGDTLHRFFVALAERDAWFAQAEQQTEDLLPLGAGTTAAVDVVAAIEAKVDDWFVRSRLAALGPDVGAEAAVDRGVQQLLESSSLELNTATEELRRLPLARIVAGAALDLTGPMNPAWQDEVDALRSAVVQPLLGPTTTTLTESQWRAVQRRLAAHRAWRTTPGGAAVATLPRERVRVLLSSGVRARLEQAIAEDRAVEAQQQMAEQVERLARCWRDLFRLARNFVSFADFYARKPAIFQAGTLHLDARTTDLCVHVFDVNKHATLAIKSGTYLVYVECTRPGFDKRTVACALTAGDSDMIFVGRNGVFYDRQGRDWDATVTRIVENPISIGQAFWSPYKKFLRWLEDTVARRAAAADDEAYAMLQTSTAAAASGSAPRETTRAKIDVGVVAALGVAVGGITAALGALLQAFFGLGLLMPVGVLGAMALISGPAMFLAWLKLRGRNIGPLLDANGWAVNAHTTVNIPLGRSFTTLAVLPPGSSRSLVDPFAPPRRRWPSLLLALLLCLAIAWTLGSLEPSIDHGR
jgi:hypothetical protein